MIYLFQRIKRLEYMAQRFSISVHQMMDEYGINVFN